MPGFEWVPSFIPSRWSSLTTYVSSSEQVSILTNSILHCKTKHSHQSYYMIYWNQDSFYFICMSTTGLTKKCVSIVVQSINFQQKCEFHKSHPHLNNMLKTNIFCQDINITKLILHNFEYIFINVLILILIMMFLGTTKCVCSTCRKEY